MSPRSSTTSRSRPSNGTGPPVKDGNSGFNNSNNNNTNNHRHGNQQPQPHNQNRHKSPQSMRYTRNRGASNNKAAVTTELSGCARTDFATLAMKGTLVRVRRRMGSKQGATDQVVGIFDEFDYGRKILCLSWVQTGTISNTLTLEIPWVDVICIASEPINYGEITTSNASTAVQGKEGSAFAIDAEISKAGGSSIKERELARWRPSDEEEGAPGLASHSLSLEDELVKNSSGWDQFDANRRLFGIVPTFDESQYTTLLDRSGEQYHQLAAEAEQLAEEINRGAGGLYKDNIHMTEERGGIAIEELDEEDRYGAVVRGSPATTTSTLLQKPITDAAPPSSSPTSSKTPNNKPVSFREAALRTSPSFPPVTMPKSVSSTVRPSPQLDVSSPTRPAESTLAATGVGANEGNVNGERKPRKSIANLAPIIDAKSLELAREEVEQATVTMQRRMSQVAAAELITPSNSSLTQQKESTDHSKLEPTSDIKGKTSQAPTQSIELPSSLPNTIELSPLTSSVSPNSKLNPHANDFVPTTGSSTMMPNTTAVPYYNPYAMAYIPPTPYYPGTPFYPSFVVPPHSSGVPNPFALPYTPNSATGGAIEGGTGRPVNNTIGGTSSVASFNPYAANFYYDEATFPSQSQPSSSIPTFPNSNASKPQPASSSKDDGNKGASPSSLAHSSN